MPVSGGPYTAPSPPEMPERPVHVTRTPIVISAHAIALVTVFEKATDDLDDIWSWDWIDPAYREAAHAADELIRQVCHGGNVSVRLLKEIRRAAMDEIKRHDEQFGTNFAAGAETTTP